MGRSPSSFYRWYLSINYPTVFADVFNAKRLNAQYFLKKQPDSTASFSSNVNGASALASRLTAMAR
jgi:hypothetical protein